MTQPWQSDSRFRSMRTFDDMRALVLAWLREEVADLPTYMGGPDPETAVIRDQLITCNQRRLLTVESQPGAANQRAYLSAVAPTALADRIWQAVNKAGLIAIQTSMADPIDDEYLLPGIPVSTWNGDRYEVMSGYTLNRGDFFTFAGRGPGGAHDDFAAADIRLDERRYVHLDMVDPVWNRPTHLFDVVVETLTGTTTSTNPR